MKTTDLNFTQQMIAEKSHIRNLGWIRQKRIKKWWPFIGSVYSFHSQSLISRKLNLTPTHPKSSKLNWIELDLQVREITQNLGKKFPLTSISTKSERILEQRLQLLNLKFERHIWIGNHCVDFFLSNFGGSAVCGNRKMFGLAIEVNGSVHDHQLKMFKDETLGNYLQELSIGVFTIENSDVSSFRTLKNLSILTDPKFRLDSRACQRVERRLNLESVLHHSTDLQMLNLFEGPAGSA